jgi:hypothetical protein
MLTREDLLFTDHAVNRMAERGIAVQDVLHVIMDGEVIELSLVPGRLLSASLSLGFINQTPLHVLWAEYPETRKILIITTYVPDARWESDFRGRKPQP